MPIKVKKKIFLKDMPKDIKKKFGKDLKKEIGDEIILDIIQGKSPVRSHTFKPYADIKYKGRKKPVDMHVSGKMLKSIRVKQDRLGRLLISFKSKTAAYHQEGTSKMPQRKLLPAKNEQFNIRLTKFIKKILELAVKKTTRKR